MHTQKTRRKKKVRGARLERNPSSGFTRPPPARQHTPSSTRQRGHNASSCNISGRREAVTAACSLSPTGNPKPHKPSAMRRLADATLSFIGDVAIGVGVFLPRVASVARGRVGHARRLVGLPSLARLRAVERTATAQLARQSTGQRANVTLAKEEERRQEEQQEMAAYESETIDGVASRAGSRAAGSAAGSAAGGVARSSAAAKKPPAAPTKPPTPQATQPPSEPGPDDCCGNDCPRCVWDVYFDRLEKYEAERGSPPAT